MRTRPAHGEVLRNFPSAFTRLPSSTRCSTSLNSMIDRLVAWGGALRALREKHA
jgi:hypothetical protein